MSLKNDQELANTKEKLQFLEELLRKARDRNEAEHLRNLTVSSLQKLIKQLKEEIILYETRVPAGR